DRRLTALQSVTVTRTVAAIECPPGPQSPSVNWASALTSHIPAGRRTSGAVRKDRRKSKSGSSGESAPDFDSGAFIGVAGSISYRRQSAVNTGSTLWDPSICVYRKPMRVPEPEIVVGSGPPYERMAVPVTGSSLFHSTLGNASSSLNAPLVADADGQGSLHVTGSACDGDALADELGAGDDGLGERPQAVRASANHRQAIKRRVRSRTIQMRRSRGPQRSKDRSSASTRPASI